MRICVRPLLLLLLAFALTTSGCRAESGESGTANDESPPQSTETSTVADASPVSPPDSTTARLFEDVMEKARANDLHELPLGDLMVEIGREFMARPYLTGVLDQGSEETLVCRLDGFDCVTFLESALALARTIRAQDYTYETYARHMRDQRYRDGQMDGYCSRLHYFSEWISDNEKRGNVEDITRELGGVILDKELNFMSTHRDSYPRFATNDSLFQCIQEAEDDLRDLQIYYIPQDQISRVYDRLQSGDIIATATNIKGLDVTHTGLVIEGEDGRIGLLHASTSGGVKVSPDLQSYVQDNRPQIGIVVARPLSN